LAPDDPLVVAVAADHEVDGCGRPVFALDDIVGLADLIERVVGLCRPVGSDTSAGT